MKTSRVYAKVVNPTLDIVSHALIVLTTVDQRLTMRVLMFRKDISIQNIKWAQFATCLKSARWMSSHAFTFDHSKCPQQIHAV